MKYKLRKFVVRSAAISIAAVMTAGYLPNIIPIIETAETAYAADADTIDIAKWDKAIMIDSSNLSEYSGKVFTGKIENYVEDDFFKKSSTVYTDGAIIIDLLGN